MISIIIPLYNKEKYVQECLESCINQSYEDVEIVVVDDCSTDNSYQIAKDILAKSKCKYKVIQNNQNSGSGFSRNAGVKVADGTWVMFVDADDILHPDICSVLNGMITSSNKSYMVGDTPFVDTPNWHRSTNIYELEKSPQPAWGILINRQILIENNIWFDTRTNVGDDNMFASDLFGVTPIVYNTDGLYGFRKEVSGSLTSGHWLNYEKDLQIQQLVIDFMREKVKKSDTSRQKAERIRFIRRRKNRIYEDCIMLRKEKYSTNVKLPISYILQSNLSFAWKIVECACCIPLIDSLGCFKLLYRIKFARK